MEEYISDVAHKGELKVGDNLYIKDVDSEDYWVTAVLTAPDPDTGYYYTISPLSGEKPVIDNMVTTNTAQTISGNKNFTGTLTLNNANIATQSWVESQEFAEDSNVVHLTGAETINGSKTFTGNTIFTNNIGNISNYVPETYQKILYLADGANQSSFKFGIYQWQDQLTVTARSSANSWLRDLWQCNANTGVTNFAQTPTIPTPSEDTTTSIQADTVGARNTKIQSYHDSTKQDKTDNNLTTTDKTIVGAINEVNAKPSMPELDEDFVNYSSDVLPNELDNRVEIIQGDITNFELEAESYDIVYARLVLQHVHGVDIALKNAYRALKKGGKILITDVDEGLFGIIDPPIPELAYALGQHIQEQVIEGGDRFIGRKFWRMLKSADFSKVDFELLPVNSDEVGIEAFIPQVDYEEMSTMIENDLLVEEDIEKVKQAANKFLEADYPFALLVLFFVVGTK